jgi:hypothetical protein
VAGRVDHDQEEDNDTDRYSCEKGQHICDGMMVLLTYTILILLFKCPIWLLTGPSSRTSTSALGDTENYGKECRNKRYG